MRRGEKSVEIEFDGKIHKFSIYEALNMMQEEHIRVIISLLEKFGRDPKVKFENCAL